jgi:hypothetical protein
MFPEYPSIPLQVNLYGFSQSEAHYYKKELGLKKNPNSKPKPWYAKHYFTVEKLGAGPLDPL